jgi:hypothetical protein
MGDTRTCPRCAATLPEGQSLRCPRCGFHPWEGDQVATEVPIARQPWDASRAVPDTAARASSPTRDNRMVGIGAVIAIALVVIAGYLLLSGLRDSKGWGDFICHAKFGDPGFGNVWTRDIDGANVCYPVPW